MKIEPAVLRPDDPYGPAIAALSRHILSLQQLRQALERISQERSSGMIAESIAATAAAMIEKMEPNGQGGMQNTLRVGVAPLKRSEQAKDAAERQRQPPRSRAVTKGNHHNDDND
jgi:hypothetical protein